MVTFAQGIARKVQGRISVILALSCVVLLASVYIVYAKVPHDRETTQHRARSAIAATLDQFAVNASAEGFGNSTPTTLTWATSTLGASIGFPDGEETMSTDDSAYSQPVYVMEITGGTFVDHDISVPAGYTGTIRPEPVATLVVDAANMMVEEDSAYPTAPSLTVYGTPEVDSLIGISPSIRKKG